MSEQERGSAKEKLRNAGTREREGPQERAPISVFVTVHSLCGIQDAKMYCIFTKNLKFKKITLARALRVLLYRTPRVWLGFLATVNPVSPVKAFAAAATPAILLCKFVNNNFQK